MCMRRTQVQPFSNKKAIFTNFVITCDGFPGETFRVLKEKEIKQFGDALRRTRRVVLDALDKM
jgi:hypothetical protein